MLFKIFKYQNGCNNKRITKQALMRKKENEDRERERWKNDTEPTKKLIYTIGKNKRYVFMDKISKRCPVKYA